MMMGAAAVVATARSSTTMPVRIAVTEVDPLADPGWDRFVRAHPDGRAHHLSAFAHVLEVAYRCVPRYLAARDEAGALVGVMPLVEHRGALRGARLESLPKLRRGGPLARDPAAWQALVEAACERASALGAATLSHAGRRGRRSRGRGAGPRARQPELDRPAARDARGAAGAAEQPPAA